MVHLWQLSTAGCKDAQTRRSLRRQNQVPPGGGHHGPVPASQRGQAVRSGHCGGTSEWRHDSRVFNHMF